MYAVVKIVDIGPISPILSSAGRNSVLEEDKFLVGKRKGRAIKLVRPRKIIPPKKVNKQVRL